MTLLKTCLAVSALALTAAGAQAGEIAVIVKTTNSNFWQNVNLGAQAAIEGQSEHTLSFDGPAAESAVADQVSLVENAINRGVAGLVLAPSDPEALIPVVQRAVAPHDPEYDDLAEPGKPQALVVAPTRELAIQVSGAFGSRQEEAQRLGRLLRPKDDGVTARFYAVVSRDTVDAEFAAHRQRFLAEQGYAYRIMDAEDAVATD